MGAPGKNYTALICNHCNAHLRVDAKKPTVTCEYCGATYRTSDLLGEEAPVAETVVTNETATRPQRDSMDKKRLITLAIVLAVMFLFVRCSINVVDTSSASSSTSTVTVVEPQTPAASSSSSSSASSASSASSSSSSSSFDGSASSSSSSNGVTITPAEHKNPDAVTPEFKQQIDDFETDMNNCLQKFADGNNTMEPYLELALILDGLDGIDESELTSADKTYLRETLVHMASNVPAVLGSGFQLNLGSLQGYLN